MKTHRNIPFFVPHAGCPHCCVFCSQVKITGHSADKDIDTELLELKELLESSGRSGGIESRIAFFGGSFTAIDRTRMVTLLSTANEYIKKGIASGIRISTRPDCIDAAKLDYLAGLAKNHIVMVEYGIESCYDATLEHINRGHSWDDAVRAVKMTSERGLHTGAHFILGLPGESREMMLAAAGKINSLEIDCIKFHQLQIIKGTKMEDEFLSHPERFVTFTLEGYIDFFVDFLERLRPGLVIERFAGEVPPRFVNSTPWGLVRNVELIRMLEKRLEQRETFQGRLYPPKN